MQKQTLEVELDGRDEPVRVVVDGRDIRAWEAAHDLSFLTEDLSYTTLTELAGHAARRAGVYQGSLDEFMDAAVAVAQVDEQPARPTRRGRGGGSS